MSKEKIKVEKPDTDVIESREMEAGEKNLRKVFEEVTTHNVRLCIDYSNETRKLLRKTEENVKRLNNNLITIKEENEQLRRLLASLLQEKVNKGT